MGGIQLYDFGLVKFSLQAACWGGSYFDGLQNHTTDLRFSGSLNRKLTVPEYRYAVHGVRRYRRVPEYPLPLKGGVSPAEGRAVAGRLEIMSRSVILARVGRHRESRG